MNYSDDIKNRIFSSKAEKAVRAAVYARVSTDNEGQKESCANQVETAKRFISEHPNVQLVNVYVDDGISGKNEDNRPAYRRMIRAIEDGQIDLVIAKTTSRLNRSRYDSVALETLLVEHQATIYTLEDGRIQNLEDLNEAIVRSVDSTFNERYSKDQSEHGHDTQRRRIANKELTAKDISFGYKWNPAPLKTITINEDEAQIIRFIFEEYVYRNRTPAEILRELKPKGIKVSPATLGHYLQDERYIGKFYINKKTSKFGAGRLHTQVIKQPKENWVLVERPDLQIVDTELFELAQRIRKSRKVTHCIKTFDKEQTQAHFVGTHEFARKIFCAECGRPYHFCYSDRAKMMPLYRIHNHQNCVNPQNRVYEEDVENITKEALRRAVAGENDVCDALERTLIECLKTSRSDGNARELEKLRRQKTDRQKRLNNLIGQLATGMFNGPAMEQIQQSINNISTEIQGLETDIRIKEASGLDENTISERIDRIRNAIHKLKQFRTINREQVLNYVDKILVHSNGDLDIYLKSGSKITVKKHSSINNNRSDTSDIGKGKMFNEAMTDPCRPDTQTVQRT